MSLIYDKAVRGLPLDDVLIIDSHAHMGYCNNFFIAHCQAEGMLPHMDRLGISMAFVSHHAAVGPDFIYGNNEIMRITSQYPERFYGYITVNPNYPEGTTKELDRCLSEPGMKGIKIHAHFHSVSIDYKSYHPVYETANKKRLPVLIHVWGKTDVMLVDKLAGQYPEVRFIMGHSGGDVRAMEAAIDVVVKHRNVYGDLVVSRALEGNVEWLVREMGASKILFGTDMPFYDPAPTFGRIALSEISDDEKRNIFGLNIKRILESVSV